MFSKTRQSINAGVELKNNTVAPDAAVKFVMQALTKLKENDFQLFFEFVTKCRYPAFSITDEKQLQKLENLGLINQEEVGETTRNIVLSAVDGEWEQLSLSSPLKSQFAGHGLKL